jgi:hypothetical protein
MIVESAEGTVLRDGKHVVIQAPAEMRPGERVTVAVGALGARREAAAEIGCEIRYLLQTIIDRLGEDHAPLPDGQGWQASMTCQRLLWLLGLSDAERAFVDSAASAVREGEPGDAYETLLVFADWLEAEQGRGQNGLTIRRLVPEAGDVFVVTVPDSAGLLGVSATYAQVGRQIRDWCERNGRPVYVQAVREGVGVEWLPAERMRELGWVRAERSADFALRRVREEMNGEPEGAIGATGDPVAMIRRLKRQHAEQARTIERFQRENEALRSQLARTLVSGPPALEPTRFVKELMPGG